MQELKELALLRPLSENTILTHLKEGKFRIVPYQKNCIVHLEGDRCEKLEIILLGKVAVERIEESGKILTISEFCRGDILGGNLPFAKEPRFPMTISTQVAAEILEIEKNALFELLCQNRFFLRAYLEQVSNNAFILGDKIRHYIKNSIRDKIINYLNGEKKRQNSNSIRLTMTKKALAERFGIPRTSLSRELAQMKIEGLISYDRKTIEILY